MANKPTPFDLTTMLQQQLGPLGQFIGSLDIQAIDRGKGDEYMVSISLVIPFGALSSQSQRNVLTHLNGAGIQPTAVSNNGVKGMIHVPAGASPGLGDIIFGDIQNGNIDIGSDDLDELPDRQQEDTSRPTLEADGDAPEINIEAAPVTFEPAEIKPTAPDEQITPPTVAPGRPPIKVAKRLGAQPMTQDQIRSMLSGGE